MFTALGIVFSCTFCILKSFIGVQCSLYKYKGKMSRQFRLLLSYSAGIINSDDQQSLSFSPPGAGVQTAAKALWLFKSPLDQELSFALREDKSSKLLLRLEFCALLICAKDMSWCLLASGQLVFQVLRTKFGKVPFILSLHMLLALWYSPGTVQQHNLEYLGVLFMVRAIQPWLV